MSSIVMQLKELARHQQAEIASLRRVIEAKDTEIADLKAERDWA